ncbi:MAG TPA: EscU/YscU/HrcU family type III secretion system export apparatus switch protein, partial [Acidimicrobiia bacterium]|nr:EscU/YscU/HrcU family type III secretion system export apparatus switch protein [Acidimicrobiia bacterium]
MAGDSSQRTEKPTPKRLREAREKGQIARSPDLSAWAGMLVAVFLVQMTGSIAARVFPEILYNMGQVMARPDAERAWKFTGDSL